VSNMNKRTRDKLYPIITKRDGEYCKCCGKLPHEGRLVLDHRDNDNTNNTHTNLQILCYSCNCLKNPKGKPLDMCVKSEDESSLVINRKKEPKFIEYVKERIEKEDAVKLKDLINSGALKIDISPVTAKRYIEKHSSEGGELMLVNDLVIFSQYHAFSNHPKIIHRDMMMNNDDST
jgi:hypothetical protein